MTLPPSFNSPLAVVAAGVTVQLSTPYVVERIMGGGFQWTVVKAACLLSYGLNFYAVSRPGRLDGESVRRDSRRNRSLVTPASWAFAIWGPIFLGELVFVMSQLLVAETSPLASVLKKAVGPFMAAQVSQSLWCAAFRPKYDGNLLLISSGLLASTAFSLSQSHAAFTAMSARKMYSTAHYLVHLLPMSLHFGWVTAATLVDLNSKIAYSKLASSRVVAVVGHLSAIAATAIGVYTGMVRKAPVYSGVVSWALWAVASSMKSKITERTQKEKKNEKESQNQHAQSLSALRIQRWICTFGAVLNGLVVLKFAISL